MKRLVALAVLALTSPAGAQTLTAVDPVIADKFTKALVAGDDAAITALLSDNVSVQVTQQLGPDGSRRTVPEGKGKTATLEQYRAVIAAVGKPVDAQCGQPDGVSYYCQYSFDKPGRGMTSMIMFDGKKIGALMMMYGGAAL